jgi:hypothetical protein
MLMPMPSLIKPNPALVRTVRLRRPAAQLARWAAPMRYWIFVIALLIPAGATCAADPTPTPDWCDQVWDLEKPIPPRLNLPSWACEIIAKQKLGGKYSPVVDINPFFLTGDFDGDHRIDIAIRIRERKTDKYGLAIIHSKNQKVYLLGAGHNTEQTDNLNWFDIWTLYPKQKLDSPHEENPLTLIGDALLLVRSESSAVVLYWNGKAYAWYWLSD